MVCWTYIRHLPALLEIAGLSIPCHDDPMGLNETGTRSLMHSVRRTRRRMVVPTNTETRVLRTLRVLSDTQNDILQQHLISLLQGRRRIVPGWKLGTFLSLVSEKGNWSSLGTNLSFMRSLLARSLPLTDAPSIQNRFHRCRSFCSSQSSAEERELPQDRRGIRKIELGCLERETS